MPKNIEIYKKMLNIESEIRVIFFYDEEINGIDTTIFPLINYQSIDCEKVLPDNTLFQLKKLKMEKLLIKKH